MRVCFSRDDQRLFSAGGADKTVMQWRMVRGDGDAEGLGVPQAVADGDAVTLGEPEGNREGVTGALTAGVRLGLVDGSAAADHPALRRAKVIQRAFAPGDVILSSEPFASVLFPALQDERCRECFARADKLSRCASCKLARFSRARSPSAPRFRRVCRLSRMPCMLSGCCWLLCSTTAM
jgi:hypothetical protein